jgi:hypothetical protein
MGRALRMPSEADLPLGAVRDFVEEVFGLYREAHRPSVRHVSEMIRKNDDLAGTASPETVRRMLLGLTVPTHWPTVEAVLIVLCDLARVDPDQELSGYYRDDDAPSRRENLERAWHRALDHPNERDEPKPRVTTGADTDPWATDGPGGYSDEPPF